MQGYTSRSPHSNVTAHTEATWLGKRVNRNGTQQNGTVLHAFWDGPGKPVKLRVDWDVQTLAVGALTDSEHVTIVRS